MEKFRFRKDQLTSPDGLHVEDIQQMLSQQLEADDYEFLYNHSMSNARLTRPQNILSDGSKSLHSQQQIHRGSTPEHRGSTQEHRGATQEHRESTQEHRGSSQGHRGSTQEHRGSTQEHRGCTPVHRGATPEYRGNTSEHRGTTPEHHNSYRPRSQQQCPVQQIHTGSHTSKQRYPVQSIHNGNHITKPQYSAQSINNRSHTPLDRVQTPEPERALRSHPDLGGDQALRQDSAFPCSSPLPHSEDEQHLLHYQQCHGQRGYGADETDELRNGKNKQQTDWNGLLQDLFGLGLTQSAESTHESTHGSTSSGVASDVASLYQPTPVNRTHNGDKFAGSASSARSVESHDSGTKSASFSSSPRPDRLPRKENPGSIRPSLAFPPPTSAPSTIPSKTSHDVSANFQPPDCEHPNCETPTATTKRFTPRYQHPRHADAGCSRCHSPSRCYHGPRHVQTPDACCCPDAAGCGDIDLCFSSNVRPEDNHNRCSLDCCLAEATRHSRGSSTEPGRTPNFSIHSCHNPHVNHLEHTSMYTLADVHAENDGADHRQCRQNSPHLQSRQCHFSQNRSCPLDHNLCRLCQTCLNEHSPQNKVNGYSSCSPTSNHPSPLRKPRSHQTNKPLSPSRHLTNGQHSRRTPGPHTLNPHTSTSQSPTMTKLVRDPNMDTQHKTGSRAKPGYSLTETRVNTVKSESNSHHVTTEALVHHMFQGANLQKETNGLINVSLETRNVNLHQNEKIEQKKSQTHLGDKRLAKKLSPFEIIPNDILLKVLSHISTDNLCRCAQVCRHWYNVIWDHPSLWTSLVINRPLIDVDSALKYLTRRLSYNTPKVCMVLEKINVNSCSRLTDQGLHTLAKRCPELRYLDIQGCPLVTNTALQDVISRCVNLERLDVTGCTQVTCISLVDAPVLENATSHLLRVYLRYLDMTDCTGVTDADLGVITSQCTQLLFFYLRRCPLISDLGVSYIANGCSSLRELSLADCRHVTDLGMRELAKLRENLRYLSVAKCEKVSDQGIMHLARNCSKLRYLNVRGCLAVSDTGLEFLVKNCPRLRSLDIGKCDVTDQGLYALSMFCPGLRKLGIKSCDSITDRGVVLVAYRCCQLQQLLVQDCNLSQEAYLLVRKYCKKAIIEHTNPAIL